MMHVNQIIMLYTLSLYSALCQLYLKKAGRKNKTYNYGGGSDLQYVLFKIYVVWSLHEFKVIFNSDPQNDKSLFQNYH